MKFVNKNYYEILDVDPKATEEDVKRAYRLVRSTWTPDSIAIYSLYTPDESEAISHKIEEAFQILANPERRAGYDRYLAHVNRLPANLSSPDEFWDILHGFEPPSEDQEMLDDVTDLLADPVLEAEELAEEVVLEASGGDARGFERLMADERAGFEGPDAIPDRDSAAERQKALARGAGHPASGASVRTTGGQRAVPAASNRAVPPAPREPKPVVPAAPAAPPIKGAPPAWTPPVSRPRPEPRPVRSTDNRGEIRPEPRAEVRPEPRGESVTTGRESRAGASSGATAFRNGVSAPRVAQNQTVRPVSIGSEADGRSRRSEPDSGAPATTGWSRSYATALKPSRPLPDRPISPQMLADCEGEHGLGGTFLRMVREYKGISINDIAERTKIQPIYLRFMEEERYPDLPAAVYVEGFATQVARLLKLDVERVVRGYMDRFAAADRQSPDRTDSDDE
jgi:hypothetical protein